MRSPALALTLAILPLTTGCATRAELKLHKAEERIAEMEKYVAGVQDDNAMLQKYAIELQNEIMAWQRGAAEQALYIAKIRESCDL